MKCSDCHIDISTTREYSKLIDKANAARDFLDQHPACGGHLFSLNSHLWYSAQEVCKRGFSVAAKIMTIYYTPKDYKRYKTLFDTECKESEEKLSALTRIDVPYKEYFGEPWAFDHIEYWSEMGFVIFKGKDPNKSFDRKDWENFCGITASGRSFEEMVINTAKNFKRAYGNFSREDFLTVQEKKNQKNRVDRLCKGIKKGSFKAYVQKGYPRVSDAEISLRWAKWYAKTPHGLKNWKDTLKEILHG